MMLRVLLKKNRLCNKMSKIKNDYVSNTALTSRLSDLTQKSHFTSEIKKIDDKANKNSSDILAYESRLKQKEDLVNQLKREVSFLEMIITTTNNQQYSLNQNLVHLLDQVVI